jgi:hypothetical protein
MQAAEGVLEELLMVVTNPEYDAHAIGKALRQQAVLWLKLLVERNWGNEEETNGLCQENKENIIGGVNANANQQYGRLPLPAKDKAFLRQHVFSALDAAAQ